MSNKHDNKIDIKKLRHKAEQPLKIISLIFSLCVYALLTYLAVKSLNSSESTDLLMEYVNDEEGFFQPLIKYGIFFVIVGLVLLYIIVIWKFFKNYGETRWLIPVEVYDSKSMDHDEFKELAIKMIDVLEDRHFETTNYNELVDNLIKYLHPSDEEFFHYAKMKVEDYFEEGSKEYLFWTNKLVEFWKSLEIEPPIIDFIYDDSESIVTKRKGII